MINAAARFLNFAPHQPIRSIGILARLSEAARNYHAFKNQPDFRLEDMCVTQADQRQARFKEFLNSPAYGRHI